MPNISLTDTASQIAELQRRQRLAEALSAQGAAPIEVQSYKGIQAPISPFSALAKVLQTYMGARGEKKAAEEQKTARQTAREEAVNFFQDLNKTATPNLVAPTGAPEMINTGVPTADFTPYAPTAKENAAAAAAFPQKPVVPVPTAPIMQAPGVDGSMAGAPMVRAVPGPIDNGPARMPMANAPTIQAPQLYGSEQAPVEVNTPQQKMAMLMQAQMSGNPYLEQMAPAMYGEIKGEAKAKKVFDAIGDVSKEYGADPRIMAGIVAAGDPQQGISYLVSLGASKAAAKEKMDQLMYATKEKAEQRQLDREAEARRTSEIIADRKEGRAQTAANNALIAGLTGGRAQTAGTVKMRQEFNNLPEVKTYKKVIVNFENLKSAAKLGTPAGDQGVIFNIMKMLDPNSVVLPSEQATARNTTGVPDRIINLYNYVIKGNSLNAKQRKEFVNMAETQFNNYKNQYEQSANAYRGYATDSGYDPDKIVSSGNTRLKLNPKTGDLEPS